MRESPALKIIELLLDRGAEVATTTRSCPSFPQYGLKSVEPGDCDLAVIVTAHPGVDHEAIVQPAPTRSTCAA